MIPCSFEESNGYLSAPNNMPECEVLSVYRGKDSDGIPFVISCFKLTKEEMIEIQQTGRVWLSVVGKSMNPVHLSVDSPFNPPKETEDV